MAEKGVVDVEPVDRPHGHGKREGSWLAGKVTIALLAVILGALYWRILQDMVAQWWDDPNYSHGFLVPLFSAYLIWIQRRRLKEIVPKVPPTRPLPLRGEGVGEGVRDPDSHAHERATGSWGNTATGSRIGFAVMLLGVVMLVLGDVGAENFLSRSSLIVILAGLILFHLGPSVLRQVSFPLAFLLFMVPLPAILFYAVTFPLQSLAAQNAAWTLDLFGVPVLLDGNVLHLSQITLGVTEACSGVRSLISLLALGVAWGYLTLDKVWATAVLTASAVPITILANAGRIVSTGLIGQWFGMTYAQGFYHTFSGWLIFLIAFVAMLGVHGLIKMFGMIHRGRMA